MQCSDEIAKNFEHCVPAMRSFIHPKLTAVMMSGKHGLEKNDVSLTVFPK
jgi:hypothetical protein